VPEMLEWGGHSPERRPAPCVRAGRHVLTPKKRSTIHQRESRILVSEHEVRHGQVGAIRSPGNLALKQTSISLLVGQKHSFGKSDWVHLWQVYRLCTVCTRIWRTYGHEKRNSSSVSVRGYVKVVRCRNRTYQWTALNTLYTCCILLWHSSFASKLCLKKNAVKRPNTCNLCIGVAQPNTHVRAVTSHHKNTILCQKHLCMAVS
jgi:hypothetical protein